MRINERGVTKLKGMTKLKGPLVLRNNISLAWKKWVHALAAQNLGPRSLAGLMIHSQFLLVRFACRAWNWHTQHDWFWCSLGTIPWHSPEAHNPFFCIHIIAKYISGELEVAGFMPGNKCRFQPKKKLCLSQFMSRDRLAKLKTDRSCWPSWIYLKSTR